MLRSDGDIMNEDGGVIIELEEEEGGDTQQNKNYEVVRGMPSFMDSFKQRDDARMP